MSHFLKRSADVLKKNSGGQRHGEEKEMAQKTDNSDTGTEDADPKSRIRTIRLYGVMGTRRHNPCDPL